MTEKIDVLWDMETADPDDFFTLCLLATHPAVRLRSVTVTPGSQDQIGIVRRVLEVLERNDIPIGSRNPDRNDCCVSGFHYRFLGKVPPATPDGIAHEIMAETLTQFPKATVITGAPLHNLRLLLRSHNVKITRWVAQGGFAGDSVVPPQYRLKKFAGRETCPTFNFNGDVKGAKLLLSSERVKTKYLISKNVCHGVVYDKHFHRRIAEVKDKHNGLRLLYDGMSVYLAGRPQGKIFHDPLAACVAIDPTICTFREVEMYREQGEWGARLQQGTSTYISIAVDKEKFFQTLVG